MSRIANSPVDLPKGVEANIANGLVSIKGSNGSLDLQLHDLVDIVNEDNQLKLSAKKVSKEAAALTGTFRALINNMVVGVSDGFEKKLELIGVGYRAKAEGKKST